MRLKRILHLPILILIFALSVLLISCKDSSDVTEEKVEEIPIVGRYQISFQTDYYEDHENKLGQVLFREGDYVYPEFNSDLTVTGFLPFSWTGVVTYSYVSGGLGSVNIRRLKIKSTDSSADIQLDEEWFLVFGDNYEVYGTFDLTIDGDNQTLFASGYKLPN